MNRTVLVVGVLGALLGGCDNRPAACRRAAANIDAATGRWF